MKKSTKPDLNFNTTNLLFFMYSKRKPLIIVSIFAFIISVLVSLLITPRFRSTVIFFRLPQPLSLMHLFRHQAVMGKKEFCNSERKKRPKSSCRFFIQMIYGIFWLRSMICSTIMRSIPDQNTGIRNYLIL